MAINVKDKLVTLESLGVAYSAEQDAREEADQALSTRIDNIVAPEGDPSLTEVSDARVSGSTTHNTLKARLDADKAAVGAEITAINESLGAIEESALPKPLTSPEGVSGQVLRSKGNGETEWANVGQPTDEQINESVSDWLNNHPDATTTVDFSIASKVFPTVADMVSDVTLEENDNVATRGYYTSGDNGGANYVISATHIGIFYITLVNGLYANMLSETGVLPAESVGIKAYAAATDTPDSTDMSRNVERFNTAHYNGIYLMFGRGHYYFNAPLALTNRGTFTVQGIDRGLSVLHFPNSNGLYFCDPRYYNYYVVKNLRIDSYGHCIVCDESCLTVLDSHFEWLLLNSETGDCFHAPNYNVAKYTSQSGDRTVYDTCVQNCVFDFINASAPNGAAFCNIMGMYTYYKHINIVSCRYGFRNCDGMVDQLNTLGSNEEYFIYYDKANSYSLRWTFVNMNAESIAKAFIYTEPQVDVPSGEDPKKPETANIMTISRITAINSGWSLMESVTDNEVYPITVHDISRIELINSDRIVVPSKYPSAYNTEVVKANILGLRSDGLNWYSGGPDITYNSVNVIQRKYGDSNRRTNLTIALNGGYGLDELTKQNMPQFSRVYSDLIFGGKSLNVWRVNCSEITSQPNAPADKIFCDTVVFNVDTDTDKSLNNLFHNQQSIYPGKIITVANDPNSLHNLKLNSVNEVRNVSNAALTPRCIWQIILAPGESTQFVLGYDINPITGKAIRTWQPLDSKYYDNDGGQLYAMLKAVSPDKVLDVLDGYVQNNIGTLDVSQPIEPLITTGTYGTRCVIAECSPGDEFIILNGHGGTDRARLWAFAKSNGERISVSAVNLIVKELTITAPNNAAYLVVDSYSTPVVMKKQVN